MNPLLLAGVLTVPDPAVAEDGRAFAVTVDGGGPYSSRMQILSVPEVAEGKRFNTALPMSRSGTPQRELFA